ncbi:hypothetical protein H0H92_011003 [Tricholoma furcatifolium]|nr:hypothetical protein H0H92_011003 [Tricholoma furcatifolium]
MLSLCRRSITALRPSLFARLSTGTGDVAFIQSLLDQEVEKQSFAGSAIATQAQDATKWKSLKSNRLVKPHDFAYKNRILEPKPYQTRRPQLGPRPSEARYNDVFHQFDLDPVEVAMNPTILSHYISEMGKVYGRNTTHLTTKSQRRLGKAIRRAKMMGVIPVLSKAQLMSNYSRK